MKLLSANLRVVTAPVELLTLAARESARRLARTYHEATRPRIGATLRPGRDTPLWNALVAEIRPLLKRRGEQAILARLLALPRQRVHEFVVRRGRMPDAERTLLLMEWLATRRRRKTPKSARSSPIR
jgi:hypothetical protein